MLQELCYRTTGENQVQPSEGPKWFNPPKEGVLKRSKGAEGDDDPGAPADGLLLVGVLTEGSLDRDLLVLVGYSEGVAFEVVDHWLRLGHLGAGDVEGDGGRGGGSMGRLEEGRGDV